MPQLLLKDNIPALIKASTTTCTLAATSMGQPTRITIGGQQYKLSSTLTLNTAITGLGGLDTGVLSASSAQLWYVYACANSSGVVGLVASLNGTATGPSGFSTRYTLVGAFYTPGLSAEVGATVTIIGEASSEFMRLVNPTISAGTPPTKGAGFTEQYWWRRTGDSIQIIYSYSHGVAGAAGVGGYVWPTPGGLSFDTAKIIANNSGIGHGVATAVSTANGNLDGYVLITASTNWGMQVGSDTVALNDVGSGLVNLANATTRYGANFYMPISGWTKTLLG